MKATKLPSGNYRALATKTVAGKQKRKSFTASTKREAERLANLWLYAEENKLDPNSITVGNAMEEFNEARESTLSPATFREYERLRITTFAEWAELLLADIDSVKLQRQINEWAKLGKSPKTIKNYCSYFANIYHMYLKKRIECSLPMAKKYVPYRITDEDAKHIIKESAGTPLQLCILLAIFVPARRSEICAINPMTDIEGNVLTINKAMVKDVNGEWVIKGTKTTESTRQVELPREIAELIPKNSPRLYDGNPNKITKDFKNLCDRLGIPAHFHLLRHYSAAFLCAMGIPNATIMARGGWTDERTLTKIYSYSMQEEEKKANEKVNEKFSSLMG